MSENRDLHPITNSILEKAFGNKYEAHHTDVKIKSFEVTPGSNKGDNYACLIHKVQAVFTVRGEEKKDGLMFKCFPNADGVVNILKKCMTFRIECTMYTDVMATLNKIARKNHLEEIKVPKAYYCDEENGILGMEDLKEQGFDIHGKGVGLGLEHMKMLMEQLARLHALSYNWMENYFGGLDRFKKDYWYLNDPEWISASNQEAGQMMDSIFQMGMLTVRNVLESTPEGKELLARFDAFAKVRVEKVSPLHNPKGSFNVMNHNDAWCNNFMFKQDAGKPTDVRMFDLQMSRRCRPTIDLVYCMAGSMSPVGRLEHTSALLHHYHNELTKYLVTLGHPEDTYSFAQLEADYKDCFPFAFVMGSMHANVQLTDPNAKGNFDFEDLVDPEGKQKSMELYMEFQKEQARTNKPLAERMLQLAQEAAKMGVF